MSARATPGVHIRSVQTTNPALRNSEHCQHRLGLCQSCLVGLTFTECYFSAGPFCMHPVLAARFSEHIVVVCGDALTSLASLGCHLCACDPDNPQVQHIGACELRVGVRRSGS